MFKATRPFKDRVTGYSKEPSLRIGKKVPQNAVNLAYYFNPTATDAEKILTSDPPRQTIDHRIETQWLTKIDQASGPNGEEPSIDLFPKSIYYSDEEGYYGRLARQDDTVQWYPEQHVNQKAISYDNIQIVTMKGNEDKSIPYSDADGYKGNLYLDTVTYETYTTKDASVTEDLDYTIDNFELNLHEIIGQYLNKNDIDSSPYMNEPNPGANEDNCWPNFIELTPTKLKASDNTAKATGGWTDNKIANFVNNLDNNFEGANLQFINSPNIVSSSKPVGKIFFEKLEYEPAKYDDAHLPQDGVISPPRTLMFTSDKFKWQFNYIDNTPGPNMEAGYINYSNKLPTFADVKFDGNQAVTSYLASVIGPITGKYAGQVPKTDYDEINDFISLATSSHADGNYTATINLMDDAMKKGDDIAVWLSDLELVVGDKTITMLKDGAEFPTSTVNEIDPSLTPDCWFKVGYKYVISDRGTEGEILYNITANYHTITYANGRCSVTRTITTKKEEATSYRAYCHYTGLVNKNWVDYDGIAFYMGTVTKGNSVGNQNADDDNELLMFPDQDGYLRQIVESIETTTDESNRSQYEIKYKSYYRVEADTVYITDVFKDNEACFYKYRLKQPIYDYRGPDENGFYKGDAIQIFTNTLKDIPKSYKHNLKLIPAEYEEKTTYDQFNHPTVTEVPKCYFAELYTSFISSSTDTFKAVYNGFNDIKDDNKVLDNGIQEDIYNAPFMIKDVDYQLKQVDKKARLNNIQILNYQPLEDKRLRVAFTWKVVAVNQKEGKTLESVVRQSSILNKDYCIPCEYSQFEGRGMIISPKLNGDSIPASPRDICLNDQAGYQKADDDYEPVITDTDKDFVYSVEIVEIDKAGSVNIKCNPDGSGVITAETTLDTGFYDDLRASYTKKLDLENPYWTDGQYIYKGYKVKCIDSRNIKVKAPRDERLLDSWYPLIQFGHYSRIMDQYGAHSKVSYSMPEYDTQHYSETHGQPYVDVENEPAVVLNPHMIKTRCYPLYVIDPEVNRDTYYFNGKFYRVIKEIKQWTEAEKFCHKLGGHLAMPKDVDELNFLVNLSKKYGFHNLWLGSCLEEGEENWKWADKTSIIYSNWKENFPENDPTHAYISMHINGDDEGKWTNVSDIEIGDMLGFICELHETISVYKKVDDELFRLNIENISFSDGVIILKEAVSESDEIVVTYTYLEENYNYRGYWRDDSDFVRIDLNPNIYHTYNDPKHMPSEVNPSKNLFNKVIYFFLRPSIQYQISAENDSLVYDPQSDTLDGKIIYETDRCLYHKIDDAEPESDEDIMIGSVYIRQDTSLHSTILTDSRTRGGGVLEKMSDSLRRELEPESDFYLDIGYYDGKPYQENGVIIVRLDNRLLKEYGGRFTVGDVEQKVKRWLGTGIYPIIEFVDSYKKEDLPQYTLEVEDSYTNVMDITPEIYINDHIIEGELEDPEETEPTEESTDETEETL